MTQDIDEDWAQQIRAQAAALNANEEHLHNNLMHEWILDTWRRTSPRMWGRLTAAGLAAPLATVLQARMWDQQQQLIRQGMPVTDARELAEREHLMLEPELDREQPESEPIG